VAETRAIRRNPPDPDFRHTIVTLRDGPWSMQRMAGIAFLCLIGMACAEAVPPSRGTPTPPPYTGTWGLTAGWGPHGEVSLVSGYRITLRLFEGQVGGTSACNSYGGDVEIGGDSFRLEDGLTMTAIGCAPEVMDSESAYITALSASDTIMREGDTLLLTGPDSELHFRLLPAPPIAQLTDTIWHLVSLIEGTGPEAVVISAAPAWLILRSDGTLSGTTGCRQFQGTWVQRGDEILFTRLGADGHCPAGLRSQDGRVLGVLGDGFTAQIEDQTLTVSSEGELGLQYTAERKE